MSGVSEFTELAMTRMRSCLLGGGGEWGGDCCSGYAGAGDVCNDNDGVEGSRKLKEANIYL